MNLYNLTADLDKLREIDEEYSPDKEEIISIVEAEIERKGSGIVKLDRIFKENIQAVKNEIGRLKTKQKALENRQKNIRTYALNCLNNLGEKKIETPIGNMTVRKGASTLKIEDESKIPSKYIEVVQTYKVDKELLKSDLKDGVEIEGVYMTEPGTTLMIK
ncbi:bacteriophage resistance protein [[Clostridium] sordellii]|uniref:siphovirus Gp157 family protein n=1 Tax=Paraclostridium sordellii TaxID=1505 RepID=UPI0005DF5977|nr:siphovirus Gp157 family protein [Paeniclostridium sordellii]CEQ10662.1 bacteriophage resistance protein [[Clostridium] sordellii] [Paeniclostridium sordellii]